MLSENWCQFTAILRRLPSGAGAVTIKPCILNTSPGYQSTSTTVLGRSNIPEADTCFCATYKNLMVSCTALRVQQPLATVTVTGDNSSCMVLSASHRTPCQLSAALLRPVRRGNRSVFVATRRCWWSDSLDTCCSLRQTVTGPTSQSLHLLLPAAQIVPTQSQAGRQLLTKV